MTNMCNLTNHILNNVNNDYQYFCVLIDGGFFFSDLPTLVLPGSFIYMNDPDGIHRKFYVAQFIEPRDTDDDLATDFDIALYCDEVENDINLNSIRRDLKLNILLK